VSVFSAWALSGSDVTATAAKSSVATTGNRQMRFELWRIIVVLPQAYVRRSMSEIDE
jgi:hypothetical protein